MKIRRIASVTAAAAAFALIITACSDDGGGSTDNGTETAAAEASTGIVSYASGEPQNPLIPTMTNETYGSRVIQQIFAGLVYYKADASVANDVAESIESDDNQKWTIKIKDGFTFTDGTPVTAESFAKAWDYGAALENAQNLSYFFESIKGFSWDENTSLIEEGGLVVEDDHTLIVNLSQPEADFPIRLGYSAYAPLPEAFFDDPEAFGENPIGNGPYKLESWEHDSVISLVPNEDYNGARKAQNGGVDLVNYTDEDSAYNDLLSDEVDIVENVPASAFATFEDELEGRSVNKPAAIIQTVAVPEWLPEFQGEAGKLRRQAISHAINREEITQQVYHGSRTPARDYTSPVINGWTDQVPGNEVLDFDEAKAKELWAQAEAIDPVGADYELQIASNADSDHQNWIDPVCNNIRTVLGIGCEFYGYPTFDEFLDDRDAGTVPGFFRAGWQADYPAVGNFLGPIYGTGAGSNDAQWSNKDFDAKIKEAAGATDPEESLKLYQEAQGILFEFLPGIPLWYQNVTGGWSRNVDNVEFGWDSEPLLYQITKSE